MAHYFTTHFSYMRTGNRHNFTKSMDPLRLDASCEIW